MPRVLLANDDGIHAPGLRALVDVFLADGWTVDVCAPDRERSAAGHGITIKRPIVAARAALPGLAGDAPLCAWACDGTPADCVKLALLKLCGAPPDVVVSGVNNGWNIGTDVHYSGTASAAMEAAFEGAQAIAVSVERAQDPHFAHAAQLALTLARRLLARPLAPGQALNLNLPQCPPEEMRGLAEARLTHLRYSDAYDTIARTPARAAYWLKGDRLETGCDPQGDLALLLAGYATVTVLTWDMGLDGACAAYLQD